MKKRRISELNAAIGSKRNIHHIASMESFYLSKFKSRATQIDYIYNVIVGTYAGFVRDDLKIPYTIKELPKCMLIEKIRRILELNTPAIDLWIELDKLPNRIWL